MVTSEDIRKNTIDKKHIGYLAEDVDKIFPEIVVKDDTGHCTGINYEKLTVYIIEEMKKMKAQIETLEAKVAKLEAK
jgi:hypothetical protein